MTAPLTSGLVERLLRDPNPLWMREMRQASRIGRTPWILLGLTLCLSLLMCTVGGLAAASQSTPASIGSTLFQVFFSLAYFVVIVVGPAVAANAVAAEREGRTWEAVLLTGLGAKDIARGKFLAAYTTIALYVVVLAPVGALPFLFGGVTATEVVVAFAFLFLVAALSVAFGLAVSSLVSSLRVAIVVTLILAAMIGALLYIALGFGGSVGVHALWNEVPESYPVWLPLAYSRATFGLEYVLVLTGLPLFATVAPAWFLYEVTISNLAGASDDRSTGLKRWFLFSTPFAAIAATIPAMVANDDSARIFLCLGGLSLLACYLTFCAFLFVAEPAGASRRVRAHWEREKAGRWRRFCGPGLPNTAFLVAVLGLVSILAASAADIVLVHFFETGAKVDTHIEQTFFFSLYVAGFFVFSVGLTSWLRSRNQRPWVARIVATAVLLVIAAAPWVVTVIAGATAKGGNDAGILASAPSPFFAFYVVGWLDSPVPMRSDLPVVELSVGCSVGWALAGVVLLGLATHRCRVTMREQTALEDSTAAALAQEDAAHP